MSTAVTVTGPEHHLQAAYVFTVDLYRSLLDTESARTARTVLYCTILACRASLLSLSWE